MNKLYNLNCN